MSKRKEIIIGAIITFIILCVSLTGIWYNVSLMPVSTKKNSKDISIEIISGTSTINIVKQLKESNLIKNELSAKIYIKLMDIKNLQAGKYNLNNSMTAKEIIRSISYGNVAKEEINITFLEGKNMRWIAKKISSETNNSEEDVYKVLEDKEYIKSLITTYWFLDDVILDKNIYYPLEGYLYPDTYTFKNKDVTVEEIFEEMLNQSDKVLTKYKEKISNLSVHKVLTLASIVELEGKSDEDRQGIARVIYNRISKKMSLGSDVTTYYAVKIDMGERNLTSSEIDKSNPYNTRGPNMNGKLPIGPIASVSESSIEATLNPAKNDYLYFVADINGKIYFSKTYEEHQNLIKKLKSNGLWYTYNE